MLHRLLGRSWRWPRRGLTWLALLLGLAALTGCGSYVTVLRPGASTPIPVATLTPQEHGLGILAVDFDPPLEAGLEPAAGVTLLAAVKNEGLSDERDVRVTARLVDPEGGASAADLFSETVVVGTLGANEARIVRFPVVSQLPPPRDRYQLLVEVQPAPGEVDLSDNRQTFEIVLSQEQS